MSARIVVVHDRMEPPVVAGRYEVRVQQTIGGAATLGTVPADVRHVRVTGPRYRLAPNEILSTFPPANADGPFVTRLAQIALKRRTLPWERADGPTRPWMALVLLSDAEGTYLPSVPVNEAVTAGVALGGDNDDGPTCAAIEVTERVVAQVFPSRQDLPFTCHVRQVPLDDTELAQGDDDGWIAVVIGTRLPRPGVRYRACLVSLEGQWDELPDNPPVEERISKFNVYDSISSETVINARRPRADGVTLSVADTLTESRGTTGPVRSMAAPAAGIDREMIDHAVPAAGFGHTVADAWGSAATPADSPFAGQTGYVTVGTGSVILDVDLHIIEPAARLLRFPVLASWEFRCEGDKDFAALVQGLDVGLLGTLKPPASPAAAVPETSDTGHVVLDGNERDGDPVRSWYRGPFVPRAVDRRAPRAVHVADQLRRVAEDGRIELGEAAAFELGRLLALSSPSTVAALREWRRLGFSRRRADRIGSATVLGDILKHWDIRLEADALAHRMLAVLGVPEIADTRLPAGPLIDPLPELSLFADVAGTIASGLALPLEDVRASFEGTAMPELTLERMAPVAELGFEAFRDDVTLVGPMQRELAGTVERFGAFLEGHGRLGDVGPGVDDLFEGGTT